VDFRYILCAYGAVGAWVIIYIRSFLDGHIPPDKVLMEEVG
jgi:hypothetical protein